MYHDILLTVDLNDEASWAKALPAAIEAAKASGATLHVVSIFPARESVFPGFSSRSGVDVVHRRDTSPTYSSVIFSETMPNDRPRDPPW